VITLLWAIFGLVAVEALGLWYLLRKRWSRRRLAGLLANLAAGGALLVAAAAALTAAPRVMLAAVALALPAHLIDLWIRLRESD
jgi:hypothetical protein